MGRPFAELGSATGDELGDGEADTTGVACGWVGGVTVARPTAATAVRATAAPVATRSRIGLTGKPELSSATTRPGRGESGVGWGECVIGR